MTECFTPPIWPGMRLPLITREGAVPGQIGGVKHSVINLQVVQVDPEHNLIFVKGGVPGPRDSFVTITK